MEELSEQNHLDESKYEEEPAYEQQQQQQQQQQNESERFWRTLQGELNEDLPTHVKNVLRLCRLDKPLSFRCIRDETIDEAERFARKDMKYQLMGVEASLEDYYGPYQRAPHKFRFAIGERFLLKQMVTCARSKSDEFWRRALCGPPRATPTSTHRYARASEPQPQPQPQPRDASSELEPSDEEDRLHDEPPNLDQERRRLADMVRSTLLREEYHDGEDPRQVAARVKVRVEMKPMQEADGTTTRDVVTGYIKCVFCATRLMIRKQSFGTRKPRWVISNYRRHVRFHLDGKLKKPAGQEFVDQRRSTRCKTELADEQANEQTNETEEHEHEAEEQEMVVYS